LRQNYYHFNQASIQAFIALSQKTHRTHTENLPCPSGQSSPRNPQGGVSGGANSCPILPPGHRGG